MSDAVGDLTLVVLEIVLDDADAHAKEAVEAPHPFRVAPRQVVVDGDDVDALALEGVQVGRQSSDQRLAFARLHLGDGAVVQHHPANQLDVEVPHVEHAAAGLADDGKCLGQEIVERGAVSYPLAELDSLCPKLFVGEGLNGGLERIDLDNPRP